MNTGPKYLSTMSDAEIVARARERSRERTQQMMRLTRMVQRLADQLETKRVNDVDRLLINEARLLARESVR